MRIASVYLPMSKLKTFLKAIKNAQDILDTLDGVVDVDRLIGISNAQGPLAKNIKTILSAEMDRLESQHEGTPKQLSAGKSRKKKTSKSPST